MERRLEERADGVRSVERAGLAPVELQAVIRLEIDTGPELEAVLRVFTDISLKQALPRMSTKRRTIMEFYMERFEVVQGIESMIAPRER